MLDIKDLTNRQLKTLIANYEAAQMTLGGPWPLAEAQNELRSRLAARQPIRRSKELDAPWDGKTIDFPKKVKNIIARHAAKMSDNLKSLKVEAIAFGEQEDWPWIGFVMSCATYGGSKNWSNNVEPRISLFEWAAVNALSDDERQALFLTVPNPRFLTRTANNLEKIYQSIKNDGGPKVVRERFASLQSAEALIAALKTYPGIGDKYARNMPMDVYHPLVQTHFAFDHRLNAVIQTVIGGLPPYEVREAMMGRVATEIGIDAWDLDRVLYSRHTEIINEVQSMSDDLVANEAMPS
ncbi:hypothetical protein VH567_07875 [Sphingomonas sp. 4RDLI-65]|uniref:hypothetical protein n=1 Tax=Sphingomonas sp. 4RDLI-65 TaxID=3111641 RepID=UPI003C1602C0